MKNKTFYIVGGGTSGHVNPALSIAEAIQVSNPHSKIVFFVTKDGVEYKMIQETGFPHIIIDAERLPESPSDYFSFARTSHSAYRNCLNILKKDRPSVVVGTGGFVCAPLLLAAMRLNIPYLIHEQNAFPGKANRFFAKRASAVCISFESSREHFNTKSLIYLTGNPIRKVFFDQNPVNAREQLKISSDKFLVLMMGGSLGAGSMNHAILDLFRKDMWHSLIDKYPELMLVMSTGKNNNDVLKDELTRYQNESFVVTPYLDSTVWLSAADLYIGRAGASSCFEAAATGTPTIFVPFSQATDNHQFYNAKSFSDKKAAIMIEDKDFNARVLVDQISYLIENRKNLFNMSKKMTNMATPNAAMDVVKILDQIIIQS